MGGLLLLPIAIKELRNRMELHYGSKDIVITKSEWARIAFIGILNTTLSMTAYQLSLKFLPASVAAVLLASNPVVTVFLANWILKEQINIYNIITVLLTIVGVVFIIAPWNTTLSVVGLILMGIVIVTFSLYSVLGKKISGKLGGLAVNSLSAMMGGLFSFLLILLTNIPAVGDFLANNGLEFFDRVPIFEGYTAQIMPIVLWIWFFNTGFGFLAYFKGMEYTSAIEGSFVFLIKIFLGPLFSMFFLGETISGNMWIGMAFVFVGAVVGLIPGIRKLKAERARVQRLEEKAQVEQDAENLA